MRRPPRVKYIFGRAARQFSADQREAHCARVPSYNCHRRIALLPPHSLWSSHSGASWCSQFGTGAAVSDPNWISLFCSDLVPSASRSHPNSAIGSNPVRWLSFFAPAVNYDCAMARTFRRLPRAGEVESPAFVPRPRQPSFSRVCHHFRSGGGPQRFRSVSGPRRLMM